jgi:hypothetical protein
MAKLATLVVMFLVGITTVGCAGRGSDKQIAVRSDDQAMEQPRVAHPMVDVRFDGTPLGDAFIQLREATGANIFVNWRAIDEVGVHRHLPITTRLEKLPLDQALDKLLKEIGGRKMLLAWTLDDRVYTISTIDELQRNVITRAYDVRDLLTPRHPQDQQLDRLIDSVRGISPLTWRSNGGREGSAQVLKGQLIITQSAEVHARIEQWLRDRRAQG